MKDEEEEESYFMKNQEDSKIEYEIGNSTSIVTEEGKAKVVYEIGVNEEDEDD